MPTYRCTSSKLNFVTQRDGKPYKVKVGDEFSIAAQTVPAKWAGLIVRVNPTPAKKEAVTAVAPTPAKK